MFKNLLSDINTGMSMGRTQAARDAVMRTLSKAELEKAVADEIRKNYSTVSDDVLNAEVTKYITGLKNGGQNTIPSIAILPQYGDVLPSTANIANRIGQTLVHPNTKGIGLVGTGIGVGTLASNWGNQSEPMIVEAMETYGTGGTAYTDPNIVATEYAYTSPPLDEYLVAYQ